MSSRVTHLSEEPYVRHHFVLGPQLLNVARHLGHVALLGLDGVVTSQVQAELTWSFWFCTVLLFLSTATADMGADLWLLTAFL